MRSVRSGKMAAGGRTGAGSGRTVPGQLGTGLKVPAIALFGFAMLLLSCGDGTVAPPPPPPAPVATTVTVSPASATLAALEETTRFTAEVRDQNGQVMAAASVTWASSDAAVAAVDASGVATAAANGSATITATSGSASGTATVTVAQVVSAVAVSPAADTLVAIGDTVRLVAEATDANGHAVVAITEFEWSSSDTLVARVDDTGLVESVAEGEATVSATASEVTGDAELTVVAALPTTLAVSPDTVRFTALGQTEQLVAEVREQAGRVMAQVTVSWSSGDTLVVGVDSAGLLTAVGAGTTTVTAAVGEVADAVVVTVMQSAGSIVVSPSESTMGVGDTLRLVAEAFDENGNRVDGTVFSWSSSDAGIARIDQAGLVEAIAEGTARIRATADDVSGTAQITVENPDRAALVALYEATDGPNWVDNTNWLTAAPLGEWYGVETDAYGRVLKLELRGRWDDETLAAIPHGLTGPIPPELGNLRNLQELNLEWNDLTGPIPPELGQLDNLRYLYLWENRLSGHIPPELGSLGELQHLSLSGNLLTRTIPPELGDLAKLTSLYLTLNRLEGTIPPEIGNLTELSALRLDQNELEGEIPSQLGGLTKLSRLNLGWNNLTGPIPPELGNLANLGSLNLDNNELTGPIPPELGNLAELYSLHLGNNNLTGRIPPWVADRSALTSLWIGGNALTGPIPPGLGSLTELTSLYLGGNQLTGPIPPELGNLHQLERLSLGPNRLIGSVPPELGNLRRLVSLTLSGNQLSGSIPSALVELNDLVTLGCRRTEGVCLPATEAFRDWARRVEARGGIQNAVDIPWCDEIDAQALERLYQATHGDGWTDSDGWLGDGSLGRWHGVRTDSVGRVAGLDLSGNGLSGHLPDAMGLLAHLTELKVGNNALSGRMPLSLAGLPLDEFDYSDTSLCVADDAGFRQWLSSIARRVGTGALCPPLTEREALEWLFRRTNGSGWDERAGWLSDVPLENWHGVQTNASGQVVALSLRRNGLSGPIPVEIGELPALTHIDLSSNWLNGRIPSEIGRLSELRVLHLYDNTLTGPIPPEIGGLSKLTNLNLDHNRLSDAIPAEIGRLSELRGLDLGSNNLSGPIPAEVGDLSRLERFTLDGNQLSGEIPVELGRLSSLRYLYLGSNLLSGSIPRELGNLSQLVELRLGGNRLSGEIPEEIGRLANLARLDLSDNDLSGPVPAGLGNLSPLERLLLQSNQLSGEIPEEIGRLRNLVRLDLADNKVSGPIPASLGDLANLVELDLGDNQLTGRLHAELGRATKLQNLDLRSNALSGPVPPEFADLTILQSLILADNPDLAGPLPQGIKALGRLERFMAGGTGLCRPPDSGFDAWFAGIPERRLLRCAGGAAVYLTQAVQSWDDPVPLLAGKPALLRVFVTAPPEAAATMPDVRVTFHVNGTERHNILIAARTQLIPSEVMERDLEVSVNAEVPDWLIVPGLEMVIEVDPDRTLDPALGVTKRIPEEGRMAVDVQALPPFHLTLVPLLPESEPDSSIVESVLAMAEDPDGHELLDDVRTLLPITELAVTAHEPVATSFQDPFRLIGETEAIRLMEGGSGYWMGIMQPPPRTGGTNWYYLLPAGVASTGGQTSVSIREASVMAHELGHNLSLLHAPCGNPQAVDPWFPYPIGNTGAWGYDFAENALVGPDTPDLMSYCGPPDWISDFFFNKALNHRLAETGATAAAMAAEADPVRTLLLWGGRDEDGVPYLDPAFVVDAVPSLPVAGGDYTIEGATVDGTPVFSLAFDMPAIADAQGGEASFVFALPVQSDWGDDLASITLSGPGGSAVLDETTDLPMAILRDPRTGQVRGFLRDPVATAQAADAAGGFGGSGLEMLVSHGIPDLDAWRR